MATVSNIDVNVRALTAELTSGLSKATGEVQKFAADVDNKFRAIGTGIATFFAAKFTLGTFTGAAESIVNLGRAADRLGIGTEKLAGFHQAALKAGLDVGEFDKAVSKMASGIFNSGKEAQEAIHLLGLNFQQIRNMSVEQQFEHIAEAMGKVRNHAERLAIARDLFGRGGQAFANLFDAGKLEKGVEEAKKFGLAVSGYDTAKITILWETFKDVGSLLKGIVNDLLIGMQPVLQVIGNSLKSVLQDVRDITSGFRDWEDVLQIAAYIVSSGFGAYLEYLGAWWKHFIAELHADLMNLSLSMHDLKVKVFGESENDSAVIYGGAGSRIPPGEHRTLGEDNRILLHQKVADDLAKATAEFTKAQGKYFQGLDKSGLQDFINGLNRAKKNLGKTTFLTPEGDEPPASIGAGHREFAGALLKDSVEAFKLINQTTQETVWSNILSNGVQQLQQLATNGDTLANMLQVLQNTQQVQIAGI